MWPYIVLGIILFLFLNIVLLIYICYRKTFYSKNKPIKNNQIILPNEPSYTIYKSQIIADIEEARLRPCEKFTITSFDGLKLQGKFYEYQKNAPIELMFHGYRSNGERDMSSGIKRAFLCGHSAFIVDQRASGSSEGHTISFGINERYDCLYWARFVSEHFGENIPIILAGISMGGATVTLASCLDLPKNVVCALADCPFNTAGDIIKKVMVDMKLSVKLCYPFIKLGAKIFGKFDLEATSSYEAVKNAKIPIIFFHGKEDTYVPYQMSEKLYEACSSMKKLVLIDNAEHGISYLVDPDKYLKEAKDFFEKVI